MEDVKIHFEENEMNDIDIVIKSQEKIIDLLTKIQKSLGWGLLVIGLLLLWKLFEVTHLMRMMRLY